jgi:hypothetical protein
MRIAEGFPLEPLTVVFKILKISLLRRGDE